MKRKPFTKSARDWERFRRGLKKRANGSARRWFYAGRREMFRIVHGREMTLNDELKEAFPARTLFAIQYDRHPFFALIGKSDSFSVAP